MPTHVYANNNEIASKASEGKSIAAFPDVCFSPPAPPVGPMPLPYPNTGEATNTDKGTSKVFIKDKMSGMGDDSHFSKSMGDESATQNFTKGMITSALQGKCYFGLWSMNVQMEGKGVPRHLDMVTHNHASFSSNAAVLPFDAQEFQAEMREGGVTISELPNEIEDMNIEIGLFFDGTGNDKFAFKQNEVQTNIGNLYDAYDSYHPYRGNAKNRFKIYVRGVGADGAGGVTIAGGAFGTGAKHGYKARMKSLGKAICMVLLKNKKRVIKKVTFDIFGFSRGAALARNAANAIIEDRMPNIYAKSDATYSVPYNLRYVAIDDFSYFKIDGMINTEVRYLGLFDTVGSFYWPGNNDDGPLKTSVPSLVYDKTFHIIAANEYREYFSLLKAAGNVLTHECIGAHSDIGGGYGGRDIVSNIDFIKICAATVYDYNDIHFNVELEPELRTLLSKISRAFKTIINAGEKSIRANLADSIYDLERIVNLNATSYNLHNVVASYYYPDAWSDTLYLNFYYPKRSNNLIQKISCFKMMSDAISKGVPLRKYILEEKGYISEKPVENTFDFWLDNAHLSCIDKNDISYGSLFCASKLKLGGSPYKRVKFKDEITLVEVPKTRVDSRDESIIAHSISEIGYRIKHPC